MQIKICGITNIDDAVLCAELGADVLGFVFYEKSKRFIRLEHAHKIIRQLPPFVQTAGVFVNEDLFKVNSAAKQIGLNTVQLHGNETPEYLGKINSPVIKAFHISKNFDWEIIDEYKNCRLLLDSYSAKEMGGTGNSFNWNIIPVELREKIILSGGVSIENLEFIFNGIKPAAIDISSSLEFEPGKKDHQKVKKFFKKYNQLKN